MMILIGVDENNSSENSHKDIGNTHQNQNLSEAYPYDFQSNKMEVASFISTKSVGISYPPHSLYPLNFFIFRRKKSTRKVINGVFENSINN